VDPGLGLSLVPGMGKGPRWPMSASRSMGQILGGHVPLPATLTQVDLSFLESGKRPRMFPLSRDHFGKRDPIGSQKSQAGCTRIRKALLSEKRLDRVAVARVPEEK
jgi:hypothetical protein